MSDYLTNITLKNLDSPTTVLPRLPGWFEPWSMAGEPIGLPNVELATETTTANDSPSAWLPVTAPVEHPAGAQTTLTNQPALHNVDKLPQPAKQPPKRIANLSPKTEAAGQYHFEPLSHQSFNQPLQSAVGATEVHLQQLSDQPTPDFSPQPAALQIPGTPPTRSDSRQSKRPAIVTGTEVETDSGPDSIPFNPPSKPEVVAKPILIEPETVERVPSSKRELSETPATAPQAPLPPSPPVVSEPIVLEPKTVERTPSPKYELPGSPATAPQAPLSPSPPVVSGPIVLEPKTIKRTPSPKHELSEMPAAVPQPLLPPPPPAVSESIVLERETIEHVSSPDRNVLEKLARELIIDRLAQPGPKTETRPSEQNDKRLAPLVERDGQRSRLEPKPAPLIAPSDSSQLRPYVAPVHPLPVAPTSQPKLAPTIQVSIGRIEVKATAPPAPAPKKRRTTPSVMSLDEYLRQRNQGGGQ